MSKILFTSLTDKGIITMSQLVQRKVPRTANMQRMRNSEMNLQSDIKWFLFKGNNQLHSARHD